MTWNTVWPDGTISVRANRTPGSQNTEYITNTMGSDVVGTNADTTTDHFWNLGADLSGHHRFAKMPGFTDVGGNPADPLFNANFIQAVYYAKLKSAIESTAQQDVQPFCVNTTNVMQLLGIRAMGVFNASGATPVQGSVVYSHNLNTQAAGTPGIVRDAEGKYTVTFNNALPSANYLVLGGGVQNLTSALFNGGVVFSVRNDTALTTVKSTTMFKFETRTSFEGSLSFIDPLQCWFVCFGG